MKTLRVGLSVFYLACVLTSALLSCSGSQTQHRADEAAQSAALAGCIASAKTLDASRAERIDAYTACADGVDSRFSDGAR